MELILGEYLAKGLAIMLMISMPCVLTAAGIGLGVGIIQAVTQVQEQTIAAAPKILLVFMVIIIFGVGFLKLLTNLVLEGTNLAFNIVPKNDSFVLASDYFKYTKPFQVESQNLKPDFINSDEKAGELNKSVNEIPYGVEKDKEKNIKSSRQENPTPNIMEWKQILKNRQGR